MAETEEWLPIRGYEGLYEASNLGRVRSLGRTVTHIWRGKPKTITRPEKMLAPYEDEDGYLRLRLCNEAGKPRNVGVHRAVALAFIPNPHGLPQVAHLDHDRKNNAPGNLKWATNAENHQDSVVVHRYAGSGPVKDGKRTMTAEIVLDIRARYAAGDGLAQIARALEMRIETVTKIAKRQRWIHI